MTTARNYISGVPLLKCECGATTDLSLHDNRMWCSDCLWNEIVCLRKALGKVAEIARNPADGTRAVFNYIVEIAEAGRENGGEVV